MFLEIAIVLTTLLALGGFVWYTTGSSLSVMGVFALLAYYVLAGLLLIYHSVEFLGFVVILVGAGALVILFLFIVLTFSEETKPAPLKLYFFNNTNHVLIRWASILFIPTILLFFLYFETENAIDFELYNLILDLQNINLTYKDINGINISEIGRYLYLYNSDLVLGAGCLLLLALIGAIIILLKKK